MADRKSFLLRIDRELFDAVQALAQQELRSVNGQVEFLLREALRSAGRLPTRGHAPAPPPDVRADRDTGLGSDLVSDRDSTLP